MEFEKPSFFGGGGIVERQAMHTTHVFIQECNRLHISLHHDNVLHLRYGLPGGWQDFHSDTFKINCCVGAPPPPLHCASRCALRF